MSSRKTEREEPSGPDSQQPGPCCSFCKKTPEEAGPFVEGPDHVYICYSCAVMCQDIIRQERDRKR